MTYTKDDFRDWWEGVVTCVPNGIDDPRWTTIRPGVPMVDFPVVVGAVYDWGVKFWPGVDGESCKIYVRFEDISEWRVTYRE